MHRRQRAPRADEHVPPRALRPSRSTVPVLAGAEPFGADAAGRRRPRATASPAPRRADAALGARPWPPPGTPCGCRGCPATAPRWQELNQHHAGPTGTARSTRAFDELRRALRRGLRRRAVDGRRPGPAAGRGARRRRRRASCWSTPPCTSAHGRSSRCRCSSRVVPSFPAIANDIKKPGGDRARLRPDAAARAAHSMLQLYAHGRAPTSARVDQPLLLSALGRGPRRASRDQQRASSAPASPRRDVTEIVLEDSYHVATLDNDAERIEKESLAFVDRDRRRCRS